MSKETELVIYSRIGDVKGLEQAQEIIDQEQAQVRAPNGNIRVRMHRKRGEPNFTYELTTKHFTESDNGVKACTEKTQPINAEQYEMFKSVCDQFMRKVRYVFYIENVSITSKGLEGKLEVPKFKYEVDRFIGPDGQFSDWVKIDLELDELHQALKDAGLRVNALQLDCKISQLPFKPVAAFCDTGEKNGKMRDLVTAIYDKQFIRPLTPPKA